MSSKLIAQAFGRFKRHDGARPGPMSAGASEKSSPCSGFLKQGLSAEQRTLVLSTLSLIESVGANAYADAIGLSLPISGKRLLEVGSHYCWYAPYFLANGCLSYHGADLEFDGGHRQISGPRGVAEAPLTFGDFIDSFAGLSMSDCDIRDLSPPDHAFDAAFMVSTSEHFDDSRGCFAALAALLSPGSMVFINHHNYYAWNGHHRAPWRVQNIDPGNSQHLAVVDWEHVRNRVRNPDSPNYLNYIRMHELIDVISEFFTVESKKLLRFDAETGEGRLTDAIVDELARYYREELETVSLHLLARRGNGSLVPPTTELPRDDHRYSIEITWCQPEVGNAFITRIPSLGNLTGLILYEDDAPLNPRAALHDQIRNAGSGAYSVWGNYLYFSTSDNTDPASNGRKYVLKSN